MKKLATTLSVTSHFTGKDPAVRQIYDRLLSEVKKFGQVLEEPKKTSIHLVNRSAFAGVATQHNAIQLTLKSDRKLSNSRIRKSEQASANRFHHVLKLSDPKEVDGELLRWLRDAYTLSS